jgi:hypothetical protein
LWYSAFKTLSHSFESLRPASQLTPGNTIKSSLCYDLEGLLDVLEPERAFLQRCAALLQLDAPPLPLFDKLLLRMRHFARSNAALLPSTQPNLPVGT